MQVLNGESKETEQAEEPLQFSERTWRVLVENAPNIIMLTDSNGTIQFMNRTISGFDVNEVIGKSMYNFIQPEYHDTARKAINRVLETGKPRSYEVSGAGPGGSTSYYESKISPLKCGGEITGVIHVISDITEQKRLHEALRKSEEKYRDLYENAPIACFSVGEDGLIHGHNQRAGELLGYDKGALIGKPVFELYADTPQGKDKALDVFRRFKDGENITDEDLQMQKADGTPLWVSLTVNVVRDANGQVIESRSIVMDITERKRAEENVRTLSQAVDNAYDSFVLADMSGNVTYANESAIRAFGYLPEEMMKMNIAQFSVTPEDAEIIIKETETNDSWSGEVISSRKNKEIFPVILSHSLVKDAEGKPIGMLGIFRDITKHKEVERALQDSRAGFHNIVEKSADGIIVTDSHGVVRFVNPALESLLDCKEEELVGEMFGFPVVMDEVTEIDIVRKDGKPGVAEMRVVETMWDGRKAYLASIRDITERWQAEREMMVKDKAIASSVNAIAIANHDGCVIYVNPAFINMFGYDNETETLGRSILNFWPNNKYDQPILKNFYEEKGWQGELVKYKKNGSKFYGRLSINPVLDNDEKVIAIMASFIDITERKREEEAREKLNQELRTKVNELEAFSYGVAHDLRSPLVSIEGFSRLLLTDSRNKNIDKVSEDIRLIESGVSKMRELINRTLEYSRAGHLVKPTTNVSFISIVNDAVAEFDGQLGSIGGNISVSKKFPRVYADRVMMREALTNLIQNSIKYRDKKRRLEIDIGCQFSGNEVVFHVRDNGTGIDDSETEQVFDLFYRGNTVGEGSGAGLAIVKRIIEAHGGRVWAEGKAGKGTTICFTLPQRKKKASGDNNGNN